MNSPDDEIASRVSAKLSENASLPEIITVVDNWIRTGEITVDGLLFDFEKIQEKLGVEVSHES